MPKTFCALIGTHLPHVRNEVPDTYLDHAVDMAPFLLDEFRGEPCYCSHQPRCLATAKALITPNHPGRHQGLDKMAEQDFIRCHDAARYWMTINKIGSSQDMTNALLKLAATRNDIRSIMEKTGQRFRKALASICKGLKGDRMIVVSHSGVIEPGLFMPFGLGDFQFVKVWVTLNGNSVIVGNIFFLQELNQTPVLRPFK